MLKIHDAGYRIVTMTHDEIVIIAKKKEAKKALDFMIKTMSTSPDWAPGLPLAAEGGFDTSYSK
jgi:DNA polymerase